MSQEEKFKRIDLDNLPLFYKIIMKIPAPTESAINIPGGIFWAIVLPIFIILEIFLNIYLAVAVSFPLNIVLICAIPLVILVAFVRLTISKFIVWWNSVVVGTYTQREITEVLEEYIAMKDNRKKKNVQSER